MRLILTIALALDSTFVSGSDHPDPVRRSQAGEPADWPGSPTPW
jgi:hypothetical protein